MLVSYPFCISGLSASRKSRGKFHFILWCEFFLGVAVVWLDLPPTSFILWNENWNSFDKKNISENKKKKKEKNKNLIWCAVLFSCLHSITVRLTAHNRRLHFLCRTIFLFTSSKWTAKKLKCFFSFCFVTTHTREEKNKNGTQENVFFFVRKHKSDRLGNSNVIYCAKKPKEKQKKTIWAKREQITSRATKESNKRSKANSRRAKKIYNDDGRMVHT